MRRSPSALKLILTQVAKNAAPSVDVSIRHGVGGLLATVLEDQRRESVDAGKGRRSEKGRLLPAAFDAASVRYRRISFVAGRAGEGPLAEPTAATQPRTKEPP
jgi:hypothetical protein